MKLQKKENAGGQFIDKKADIKNGDIVTILNGGVEHEGQYGVQFGLLINTKNGERVLDLNQTTKNNLIDAFGDETESWIGKEVKVWVIRAMVGGKMCDIVYLSAKDWEMDDEGKFHAVIQQN